MEKYELEEEINKGYFGTVCLMSNKETEELVAVKLLRRGSALIDMIKKEVINHRSLNHPNVIGFKEVVLLTPPYLGIVMEYAPYGDLINFWSKVRIYGGIREDHARHHFQQIIHGIEYIHSKGICHRDLKLENLLIGQDGRVKICDFGYSKSEIYHSRPKSRVGTPSTTAPEVLSSSKMVGYDGKIADIWSCGVILYTMVVGSRPFDDRKDPTNMAQCVKNILACSYKVPDTSLVSEECIDLIGRILVVDPSKRISIQEIKNHPWFLEEADAESKVPQPITLSPMSKRTCSPQTEDQIMAILAEAKKPGVQRNYFGKKY